MSAAAGFKIGRCCRIRRFVRYSQQWAPHWEQSSVADSWQRSPCPRRTVVSCAEPDVQVFRFTLGIPGFDDRYIPRIAGFLGALLIAVNHLNSSTPLPPSQSRAEVIGVTLAVLCTLLPTLETALLEASGNVGRRAASTDVAGATAAFVFDKAMREDSAKEVAWASFACLRTTNTAALLILKPDGELALARGALGAAVAPAGGGRPTLASVAAVLRKDLEASGGLKGLPKDGEVLRSRREMQRHGIAAWGCVAEGCATAALLPIGARGALIALSEFEDGFPPKDVAWLRAIAAKLGDVLS